MKILAIGDFQGRFSSNLFKKIKKENFDLIIGVGDYTGLAEWKPYIMYMLTESKKGKEHQTAEEFFGKLDYHRLSKKDEKVAKYVLKILNSLGKPVILVFGNGDDEWYDYPFGLIRHKADKKRRKFLRSLVNIQDITYRSRKLKNITFVGFGGYMDIDAYFDIKNWKEEDKEAYLIREIRREESKIYLFKILRKTHGDRIFVFHYPPSGVFDIIKDGKRNPMNGKSAGQRFFREAILKYKPRLVLCGHMHEYQGAKKIGKTLVVNPGDAEKNKYAVIDYPEKGKIKVKFVKS